MPQTTYDPTPAIAAADHKKPAAKVGHTKSRTGCLKCRSRKVKCGEQYPTCSNCRRLGLDCQYPAKTARSTAAASRKQSRAPPPHIVPPAHTPDSDDIREQRMQLRLLHAYMSRGLMSTAISTAEGWRRVWFVELPRIALEHDNLLYTLLAFSATQLLDLASDSEEDLILAQTRYWERALQEQQKAILQPNTNIEATTLAAWLISINVFGMLRKRPLQPYEPPMDWFEVSQGAWIVGPDAMDLISQNGVLKIVQDATKSIWENRGRPEGSEIDAVYRPILTHLLPEEIHQHGGQLADIVDAYEHALTVVSAFRKAVAEGEPTYNHTRRVSMFAQLTPSAFVRFLAQKRPRALVILACFFAITTNSTVLQIFGDSKSEIPRREIEAIRDYLPEHWTRLIITTD